MFDITDNFHDNMMQGELNDMSLDELKEMLARCLEDEFFEIARIVKLEIDSRSV